MRQFIEKRQRDGAGNAAINNSLSLLRRMFSLARKEEQLTVVPFIGLLKKPKARQGFTGEEPFYTLLAALPAHLQPLILFLYRCGGRVGEALDVEWLQVPSSQRKARSSLVKISAGRGIAHALPLASANSSRRETHGTRVGTRV